MESFVFYCKGHPNIRATHKSTLEFTTDEDLSLRGDCIIGVNSSENLSNFPLEFKEKIRSTTTEIVVKIQVGQYTDLIKGYGNPKLELTDKEAIVVRRSDFVCSRTMMINSDKAANDIKEQIITRMKNPGSKMKVTVMITEK
jgi:hypothetical protein